MNMPPDLMAGAGGNAGGRWRPSARQAGEVFGRLFRSLRDRRSTDTSLQNRDQKDAGTGHAAALAPARRFR